MSIPEIIETYQQLGIGGVLIVVVIIVGRYLMRQNKRCYDSYQAHVDEHKNEIRSMTIKMMRVLDQNNKAVISLTNTIERLDSRIKGCAFEDVNRFNN